MSTWRARACGRFCRVGAGIGRRPGVRHCAGGRRHRSARGFRQRADRGARAGRILFLCADLYALAQAQHAPQHCDRWRGGAFPPLVGWAAITGRVDLTAVYLFLIIFYWTPPHFWALALLKQRDYGRAGVPMAPLIWGERTTTDQYVWYTVILCALTLLPVTFGAFGLAYLVSVVVLDAILLAGVIRVRRATVRATAAWSVYKYSLLYLALLFAAMAVDRHSGAWLGGSPRGSNSYQRSGRKGRGAQAASSVAKPLARLLPLLRPYAGRLAVAAVCLIARRVPAFFPSGRPIPDGCGVPEVQPPIARPARAGTPRPVRGPGCDEFRAGVHLTLTAERVIARLREDPFAHLIRLSPALFHRAAHRGADEPVVGRPRGLAVAVQHLDLGVPPTVDSAGGRRYPVDAHPYALAVTTLAVSPIVVAAAFVFGRALRRASRACRTGSLRRWGRRMKRSPRSGSSRASCGRKARLADLRTICGMS